MNRRVSPKAIVILFVVLLAILLPATVVGVLYMQGNKDPQAMVSALQHRFAGAPARVVIATPAPVGTPGKAIAPTPTPTPIDLAKEAAQKIADAKKLGGDVTKEAETNPATRGLVGFLGRKLPKEIPIVGDVALGDALIGIILLIALLVLVAGVIARLTKSPREQLMGSDTVQSFLDDFWTWFVRLAGVAIYVAVIAANIQTNPIKAFLLPFGSAFVIMISGSLFEKFKEDTLTVVGQGTGLIGFLRLLIEGAFNVVEFIVVAVFVFIVLFGGIFAVTASGKSPAQFSAEITKILTNIPWLSEVASRQLTNVANFIGAAIALSALVAPNGDLSVIGSLVGTVLLFHDVKISGMLKRTEETEEA